MRDRLGCSLDHNPVSRGKPNDTAVFALAAASGFARPPDGSDRCSRPRGLLSELAPSRSPDVDVRHCYAADPGNCCDGTFTRVIDAVTGCTPHTASLDVRRARLA